MLETQAFDRAGLHQLVGQVGDQLAELAYIDRALEYLRNRDLLRYKSNADQRPIEFGRTHPFWQTAYLGASDDFVVDVEAPLQQLAVEADGWSAANIVTLRYYAGWIAHPDAATYTLIVDQLNRTRRDVLRLDDDLGKLANDLGDWKGEAATAFSDHFIGQFDRVRNGQAYLLQSLSQGFEASKAIALYAQHSLMNAVFYTKEAVDEQLKKRQEDNRGRSVKEFLVIASDTAALMSALSFKVDQLSAGLDVASSVADIGLFVRKRGVHRDTPIG